jgi:2'-5' RNA ligase
MGFQKYFIAIVLPEPLLSKTEAIKHELLEGFGLKGALRSPAHITLHRPFEWKEEKEQALLNKLREFKMPAHFEIDLHGFAAFKPRVIYVNVVQNAALTSLHTHLKLFAQKELKLFNEVNDERGFHAHVTVAFRDLKRSQFERIWSTFGSRPFSGNFTCRGFELLKLNKRWDVLQTFQL